MRAWAIRIWRAYAHGRTDARAHTHACTHACADASMRARMHARARVRTYARTHGRAKAGLQASDREDEGDLEREACACVGNKDTACICTRTHGRARAHTHARTHARTRACARACMHVRVRARSHARTGARTRACKQATETTRAGPYVSAFIRTAVPVLSSLAGWPTVFEDGLVFACFVLAWPALFA